MIMINKQLNMVVNLVYQFQKKVNKKKKVRKMAKL